MRFTHQVWQNSGMISISKLLLCRTYNWCGKKGNFWLVTADAEKPVDGRYKVTKTLEAINDKNSDM